MICVLATIELVDGGREAFLKVFHALVPTVLQEEGCYEYGPMADVPSGLAPQMPLRPNTVVIVEKWAGLKALQAHLAAPHMATYRAAVKSLVVGMQLQVLQPV